MFRLIRNGTEIKLFSLIHCCLHSRFLRAEKYANAMIFTLELIHNLNTMCIFLYLYITPVVVYV